MWGRSVDQGDVPLRGGAHRRLSSQRGHQMYRKEEKGLLFDKEWCHRTFRIWKLSSDMDEEKRTNSEWSKARCRWTVTGKKGFAVLPRESPNSIAEIPSPFITQPACLLSFMFSHSTAKILSVVIDYTTKMRQKSRGFWNERVKVETLVPLLLHFVTPRWSLLPYTSYLSGSSQRNSTKNSGIFRVLIFNLSNRHKTVSSLVQSLSERFPYRGFAMMPRISHPKGLNTRNLKRWNSHLGTLPRLQRHLEKEL